MATLRNKKDLAAMNRENHENHPRNVQAKSKISRIQEDYITQVSEEIEDRVTKNLSKEFSKTESRTVGALSRLDECLQNPQSRARSGPALSRENQGTNEARYQNDPHAEVGVSLSYSSQELSPGETFYSSLYLYITDYHSLS